VISVFSLQGSILNFYDYCSNVIIAEALPVFVEVELSLQVNGSGHSIQEIFTALIILNFIRIGFHLFFLVTELILKPHPLSP